MVGTFLGGGLILTGIPRLVVGSTNPHARDSTACLLAVSCIFLLSLVVRSGSVTALVALAVILLELLVFWVFVFPARYFEESVTPEATAKRSET